MSSCPRDDILLGHFFNCIMASTTIDEPLLQDVENRYTLFPIQHQDVWDIYTKMKALMWHAEEINLERDLEDWPKMTEDERHFIKYVLAFFAGADGIVLENLGTRFMNEISIPEVRCVYGFQLMMENIHSHTYSLLIDTLIKNPQEKEFLFNGMTTIPVIGKKDQWALKWIDSDASFPTRLLAFLVVEGIFFSGSFCALFWLKGRNLMPGLCFSNELISKDENLHAEFAVLLYSKIVNKLDESVVHAIFKEAVDIEKEFINEAIPCRLIGMNAESMATYIEFVADYWLKQLGYSALFNASNPFSFMVNQSLSTLQKTDFFAHKVSNYNMASIVMGNVDYNTISDF